MYKTCPCALKKGFIWTGKLQLYGNIERNGFNVEMLWVQKKTINWKGQYCEMEVWIFTANKKA
jgi:hypothetical protein